MTATTHRDGDTVVLRLAGELDIAARDVVARTQRELVDAGPRARTAVIDLTAVSFIDCVGTRLLRELADTAAEHRLAVAFCGASTRLRVISALCGEPTLLGGLRRS